MCSESIINVLNYRHACKQFDAEKKIPDNEFDLILESFRLSPSSFGMEPWRVLVVENSELKTKIQALCWNQAQITSCSKLVIFTVDISSVKPFSENVAFMFSRRGLPQEMQDAYNQRYADYHQGIINSANLATGISENISMREMYHWCAKQCYIAAANMMTTAAQLGIDSCPIEGFEKENLEKLLGIDTPSNQIVLVLPFGYRVKEQTAKFRLPIESIVKYI